MILRVSLRSAAQHDTAAVFGARVKEPTGQVAGMSISGCLCGSGPPWLGLKMKWVSWDGSNDEAQDTRCYLIGYHVLLGEDYFLALKKEYPNIVWW